MREAAFGMHKELTTAIALGVRSLDWTRLERVRNAWRVVASRRTVWDAVAPEKTAPPEGPEEAPPPELPEEARAALAEVPEKATLCIPSAQALFRCLSLPTTDAAEVDGMVALQLDKMLPLPPEEMSCATETLSLDEGGTTVLACAVPGSVLEEAVRRAGLSPRRLARIDVAALALVRLLAEAGELQESGREVVLYDEGGTVTVLVLDAGLPVLVRPAAPLDAPGSELVRAVRLSLVEAEVERGVAAVERLTLVTQGADAAAVPDGLAEAFGCAVRTLGPDGLGPVSQGAALRSASRCAFDLTPPAWRTTQAGRRFRAGLFRAAGAALLLWFGCVAALYGGPFWFDRQAALLDERLKILEPSARMVRDVRNRVRIIQAYMDRELSPLETLRTLCALLPEGIEFSSFRYRREDRRMSLQGSALSTPLVYEFKQRVDDVPLFGGSALVSGPTTNPRTRGADFELVVLFREASP